MNAQICWSQIGQARMIPAASATLSRSMNWSNGAVAKSRHWPSGAMVARAEAGSEQYGPRSHSPRLWKPRMPWLYQKKPMIVVTTIARDRDQQPVAQFMKVVDQRHGAVGVDARTTLTRVESLEESWGLHGLARRGLETRRHAALTVRPGIRQAVCLTVARTREPECRRAPKRSELPAASPAWDPFSSP